VVPLLLLLAACRSGPERLPPIGEAYVGPSVLNIRSDIPLQSPTVATVKHGDRLLILQRRRRFFKVRAPNGAEGWTDERQLLAAEDMAALRELSERAAKMPPQGRAGTYGELNVHTQPARGSPSFLQVKEGEKMAVLAHVITPRTDVPRKPLLPPPPKRQKAAEKKNPKREPKYPPPPMPKPPAPPKDWLELSRTDHSDDEAPAEEEEAPADKPVLMDDWSLVRTASGQSGWVLTRRLIMAIPDEVAQYAEGHRIVSYFSLGEVTDGDQKKPIWLWTTIGDSRPPYDFDSFRVFIWSIKRHRYETAYIERNLIGYAPVLLKEVDISTGAKVKGQPVTTRYPGFSICEQKVDGQRYRREYALITNIVRFAGEHPCEGPQTSELVKPSAPLPGNAAEPPQQQQTETFTQRFKKRLRGWLGR
jgi:hypothetical protein